MSELDIGEVSGAWDYRTLSPNIVIGADCWLERKAIFANVRNASPGAVKIGDRVRVFTWSAFSIEPEGYVEIGNDCNLVGPVFMCAKQIRIGDRVTISYNVTIADSDFHPHEPQLRKQDAIANAPFGDRSQRPPYVSKPVVIEDDVSIGIGSIILKGVRIGKGARVAAGSVVTADVPANVEVAGNPARPVNNVET
jgi:acetyltransferase-like isoleucine patch superfamily enzyme